MKKDERLRTIYEVIAPHVVRSESNWRDYLSFAARFHKHSFDNMLLVYAQKDDVTMLATSRQWNSVGRYINRGEKGIAVCVYENARMTIDHLFDISQTNGRQITPTNWQLTEATRREMAARISYSHGYEAPEFHELLYALAAEAVGDHYEQYLQGLGEDIKGHLFSELPAGGFEAQFIQLLVDSVAYVIGQRCCLLDEEIRLGDGMRTISHFNTLPLIARAGNAVTAISKGILLELERTLRIINKERKEHHEQAENRTELHRERRDSLSQSSSVQRQPGGSAPGPVREDGAGIPPGEPPRPVYNFENGWQPDGDHAPGTGGGDGENRSPDPADAQGRPIAGGGGHAGADEALQQLQAASGGNRPAIPGADSPVNPLLERTDETPASTEKEPSIDGSFFVPFSPDAADRWAQLTSVEVAPLPFEEGLPSAVRAAEMKEWLKQHGSRFTPTYTILYHATGENVPVMEKGLLPTSDARRRSYQSESGYVYLAATPERAKTFGDLGNGSKSIVYEVIVPVHKLLPDADQLHNLRAAGTDVGNSIEESIVYAGGARVKGAIEQWQIRPFDYAGYLQYKEALAKADEAPAHAPMSDEEVRRHYEFILTSTDLYPAELHQGMREILADPPPDGYWIRKAPAVCALFSKYGNREYQGEVLYRTVLRGEDGISMYFGDGYTYLPWHTVANIVDAMIEDGDYPAPLPEKEPDPVGDFNIPDEIDEMPRQMETDAINRIMAVVSEYEQEDSQAQTLAAPDYGGEQLTLAGIGRSDEDMFRECCVKMVPLVMRDEAYLDARHDLTDAQNAKLECAGAIGRAIQAWRSEEPELHRHYSDDKDFQGRLLEYVFEKTYTDTVKAVSAVEQIGQGKPKLHNDAPHRNYRKFEKLFPQVISGEYRYLRLESEGFMPLSVEWVYGDCISIMHTFVQDGDLMRDPEVVVRVDREEKTLQAVSFQQDGGLPIYQEVMDGNGRVTNPKGQRDINSFFTQWLSNISEQGYEPVRAVAVENGEDVEIDLTRAAPQPERSREELLAEAVLLEGSHVSGGKRRIYDMAAAHPAAAALASFLKNEYGIGGFSGEKPLLFVDYNSEGIVFRWLDEENQEQSTRLTWNKAANIVQGLVDGGRYLEQPPQAAEAPAEERGAHGTSPELSAAGPKEETRLLDEALDAHNGQIDMLLQAVRGELTVGTIRYSIFEGRPHIGHIEVLEGCRRQGIATQMVRYLQGQYPYEEIEWGYLTDDGSAFYHAVVEERPNEDYLRVKSDLEDITRQFEQYAARMDNGGILSPMEAEDMDELSDIQYRLEGELQELRPTQAFVRMEDRGGAGENEAGSQHLLSEDGAGADMPAVPGEAKRLPPQSAPATRNFRFSEEYGLYPGGAKTKYRNNVTAIKTLKQIEAENRGATPEEQITLARYVGWGGLANAFSEKASGWEAEYRELKTLLTEDEYKAARHSTITAYYTEPELIRHIYRGLERFGFHGGPDRKILDPGMGTGNFYSVLPESLRGTKLYGVELDSITGRIARQLYPEAEVSVMGYEAVKFEDNSFDVILGNIPFNSVKVYDRRYNDLNPYIHDYFFIKSLDLAKPGGIIAFITSKGILDRKDESLREYIAQRAEFIGAIRLPNNAFAALAGTEVTADLIILKKREQVMEISREDVIPWLGTEIDRSKWISYNRYFFEHPEMLMGQMEPDRKMYGREDGTACVAPEGFDLYERLPQAIAALEAEFTAAPDEEPQQLEADEDEPAPYEDAPEGTRNFTFLVRDDEIFYCEKNKLIPQPYTGMKAARIKGLCEIRGALLDVVGIQSQEYNPGDLHEAQKKLNEVYDRFVAEYGPINAKGNILAFSDDDQFPLLRSIEDQTEDKTGWVKAAVFTKATIRPYRMENHADTAEDALQICLNQKLRVDLSYMAYLSGRRPEELSVELAGRIFLNPQKYYGNPLEGWELAEEYLSGHVRDKLLYARQKAVEEPELFSRNVEALEAVQPVPLTPADIEVNIGAIWIPAEYYRQFIYETFDTSSYLHYLEDDRNTHRIDVEFSPFTTAWRVSNKNAEPDSVKVNQTFGTARKNAYAIFEDCLNMQSTTVRDRVDYINEKGSKSVKYVINAKETMIARAKQQQIQEAFALWIWKEPERRDALLAIYNETFNVVRPREYDGSHLVFPGMNEEMSLRRHQLDFAARVIYSGTGLAAHEVGAGKTAALLAAGMYLKNLGAIQKPVFVVPNPLVGQWATEFYRFFPNANLLVSTENDFTPQNRNRYISRIATGEYDAVILAHSQFEKLPISAERQIAMLEKQINEISRAIDEAKMAQGENWSIKQMAIFQDNLETRLKRLSAEEKKDDLLTFEQLGVDMMMVDEAHYFKNCFVFTKLRNVAGINTTSSQRAFDMLLKCQYLQEMNQGRGVVFATGTPISNSITEMFVMQRYLQPQELERFGWTYFDTWLAHFGRRTSALEIKPEGGGYRMRDRIAKFYNMPELMAVFKEVADIKTADMLDIPNLPQIKGGKAQVIATDATDAQKAVMADFILRAEAIHKGKVKPEEDNMLKLTGEARLMAIDPRLVNPRAENDPGSKLNVCINEVYDVWAATLERRSTQLVFCDVGTPKPGRFNIYDEFRRVLMEKGVPAEEIAFIHDAATETQRQALFERMRKGEVRVLLGSTSKLGTGVNVQDKVIAINHLDCPWKPSDITQRNGRGIRQGNENPEVMVK